MKNNAKTPIANETSVIILAAGHGTRMKPLTNNTPKPLLKIGACSLIEHHINNLAASGFKLSLIKSDVFLVINADIYTDFNFASLLEANLTKQGCIVLVPNPQHNPSGDFGVNQEGMLDMKSTSTMTFSGISLYRKEMFKLIPEGKLALGPILKQLANKGKLDILPYSGNWTDVGTPERLAQLNER